MSTTIALIASTQAAQASVAAHKAKLVACTYIMERFEPKAATLEQTQSYADCVSTVYPKQMAHEDVIILKAFFVIAILGMLFGLLNANKILRSPAGVFDYAFVGFLGFVGLPIATAAVAGFGIGVLWLVS